MDRRAAKFRSLPPILRGLLSRAGEFLRAAGIAALALGALTLLLAMVGLFGIQSHIVGHRTREIGVRMSFGASPTQIKTTVLKDGYGPVLEGLAIGSSASRAGQSCARTWISR